MIITNPSLYEVYHEAIIPGRIFRIVLITFELEILTVVHVKKINSEKKRVS